MLVTRPEPGLSGTVAALRARGFTPIACPMQQISPVVFAFGSAEARCAQAVLLTSGQAVASLAHHRDALRGRPVLAVGDATAERARRAGFADVESAAGDATALARLATNRLRPANGPLLLACGARHGLDLARALRGNGFQVRRRVAYRTDRMEHLAEAAAATIGIGAAEAALFFSGEAAFLFRRALPPELAARLSHMRALAISTRVAARLEGMGWSRIEVAARPDAASLLDLVDAGA